MLVPTTDSRGLSHFELFVLSRELAILDCRFRLQRISHKHTLHLCKATLTVRTFFLQTFEHLDFLRASIEHHNSQAFKCEPDVDAEFCTMAKNMNANKNAHDLHPVIISETGKVLREVACTISVVHGFEQAANGCDDVDMSVPMRVYRQACAQVKYHKSVALRGRPPKCFTDVPFDLRLEYPSDSVRLRKALLKMKGTEMKGTFLQYMYNVNDDAC